MGNETRRTNKKTTNKVKRLMKEKTEKRQQQTRLIRQLEEMRKNINERKETPKIPGQIQAKLTKQEFQNNERKFYQQVGGEIMMANKQPDAK